MTAQLLTFPLARRQGFIRRQAEYFARQSHHAAEQNLAYQMEVQRRTLAKRGVSHSLVDEQIVALESAIRAEARRFAIGGVA